MQNLAALFFDPTAFLTDLGLTWTKLAGWAILVSVVLLFSLREFSYWFFRIHHIMKKQDQILSRLEEMAGEKKVVTPESSGAFKKMKNSILVSTGFPISKKSSAEKEHKVK